MSLTVKIRITLTLPAVWLDAYPEPGAVEQALRETGLLPPDAEEICWKITGGQPGCLVKYVRRLPLPMAVASC